MEETIIDIFCDESCHLKNKDFTVTVMGAVYCEKKNKPIIYEEIRKIKRKYKIGMQSEIKWTKVCNSKINFYKELTEYFFKSKLLSFRSIVISNKDKVNDKKYNNGDPNLLYYKMYYLLLDGIIDIKNKYRIFLDVENAKQTKKLEKLQEVLCNNKYDFMQDKIDGIWQIDSKSSELVQLADFFSGALAFYHRGLYDKEDSSKAKKEIIDIISDNIGPSLKRGTPRNEELFNIFLFKLRDE
ncbi:MAG: DUF3800 domain-containing protein [Clostridia bacterium]|nr:DUF3800 domain-containing protein [Clostridia bacterium]